MHLFPLIKIYQIAEFLNHHPIQSPTERERGEADGRTFFSFNNPSTSLTSHQFSILHKLPTNTGLAFRYTLIKPVYTTCAILTSCSGCISEKGMMEGREWRAGAGREEKAGREDSGGRGEEAGREDMAPVSFWRRSERKYMSASRDALGA